MLVNFKVISPTIEIVGPSITENRENFQQSIFELTNFILKLKLKCPINEIVMKKIFDAVESVLNWNKDQN